MDLILQEIKNERLRQDLKWGKHDVADFTMFAVLGEEVGEIAKALLENDLQNLKVELIQTAAVCVKMLQFLEDRGLRKYNE